MFFPHKQESHTVNNIKNMVHPYKEQIELAGYYLIEYSSARIPVCVVQE